MWKEGCFLSSHIDHVCDLDPFTTYFTYLLFAFTWEKKRGWYWLWFCLLAATDDNVLVLVVGMFCILGNENNEQRLTNESSTSLKLLFFSVNRWTKLLHKKNIKFSGFHTWESFFCKFSILFSKGLTHYLQGIKFMVLVFSFKLGNLEEN